MIERLLEADRLLALGMDQQAEKIYWQAAELDPRNAIAIVGLARVASDRGDDRTALQFAHKALEIDPENPTAMRLAARLEGNVAHRASAAPAPEPELAPEPEAAPAPEPEAAPEPELAPEPEPAPAPEPATAIATAATATATTTAGTVDPLATTAARSRPRPDRRSAPRRGLLRRLMGDR